MQSKTTMPVIPYPAFLVGRYAAEAMDLLREIETEKGMKPAEETLPVDSANPPDLPKTALVETTRMTEAALLSSLSAEDIDESKAFVTLAQIEEHESNTAPDKTLDLYI